MAKKVIVISLGGSLIVPDKVNKNLLEQFKETLLANTDEYKFVVVCGGGTPARTYINGLEGQKNSKKESPHSYYTLQYILLQHI